MPVNPTTDIGAATYQGGMRSFASTGYLSNPSFETDSDSDGKADGLIGDDIPGLNGTPVYSRVAGRTGGYAQRWQYAAVSGDSQEYAFVIRSFLSGVLAPGRYVFSAWVKGAVSGTTLSMNFQNWTEAWAPLPWAEAALTLTSEWQYVSLDCVLREDAYYTAFQFITPEEIDNGDSIDLIVDDMWLTDEPQELTYSGYVGIYANYGVTPASGKYAYYREDGDSIGPVIVTSTERTAGEQAAMAAAWDSRYQLWHEHMGAGDLLIPLRSNALGYVKGTDDYPALTVGAIRSA